MKRINACVCMFMVVMKGRVVYMLGNWEGRHDTEDRERERKRKKKRKEKEKEGERDRCYIGEKVWEK